MAFSNWGERNVGDYTKSLPQQGSSMATFCSKNIVQACKENSTSVFTANLSQYLRELEGCSQQVYKDTLIQIKDTAPFKRILEHQQLLRDAGIEQPSLLGHSLSHSTPNTNFKNFHQFQQPQQPQPNSYSHQTSSVTASQRPPQTEAVDYPVWPNDRDAVFESFRAELVPLSCNFDADTFPEELVLGIAQDCLEDEVGTKKTQINTMRNALRYLREKNSDQFEVARSFVINCAKYEVLLEKFGSQGAALNLVDEQVVHNHTQKMQNGQTLQSSNHNDAAWSEPAKAHTTIHAPYDNLSRTDERLIQSQTQPLSTYRHNSPLFKELDQVGDDELYGDGGGDETTQNPAVYMPIEKRFSPTDNKEFQSERFESIVPGTVTATINDMLSDAGIRERTLDLDIKMIEQGIAARYRRMNSGSSLTLTLKILSGKNHEFKAEKSDMPFGSFYLEVLKFLDNKQLGSFPIGTLKLIAYGKPIVQAGNLKFMLNSGQFKLEQFSTIQLVKVTIEHGSNVEDGIPAIEILNLLSTLVTHNSGGNKKLLLPEKFDSYSKIDQKVYQLFEQSKGSTFDVGVAEYLEFYIAIKKAIIELKKYPISGEQGKFINNYLNLIFAYIKLYKPPFVRRQNGYLDPYIGFLAGHSSQRHKEMTVDNLIVEFEQACNESDYANAAPCLLMLLQGLKYNLLTKDQANKLRVHPHFPDNLRNPLSKQIAAGKLKYTLSDALANKSASKLDEVDETSNSTTSDLEHQLNITDEQLHSMYSEHAPFGQLFYSIQPGYVTCPIPQPRTKHPNSLK